MSNIKHYLEKVSEKIGKNGEITKKVLNKVAKEQGLDKPKRTRKSKKMRVQMKTDGTLDLTNYPSLKKLEEQTTLKVMCKDGRCFLMDGTQTLRNVKIQTLESLEAHVKYNYTYFWGFYNNQDMRKIAIPNKKKRIYKKRK